MYAHPPNARPNFTERWAILLPHREIAVNMVRRVTGDIYEAEDCVHDAMVRLIQRADLDPARVRALLIRAALYIAIDKARHRRRAENIAHRLAANLDDRITVPEAVVMLQADAAQVLAALRTLPPRPRQVLAMRLLADLSVSETAATLGVSRNTVDGAYTRGLQALRARLGYDPLLGRGRRSR